MKKFLAIAAALASFSFMPAQSFAHDELTESAPWVCGLEFKGKAEGFQILVGSFKSVAKGELHCATEDGRTYDRQVRVTMETEPLSPTVGFGSFRFAGGAANIVIVNSSPRALYGDYIVAQGRAAVVGGVGAFTALHVGQPELTLQVSLQVLEGFGVEAGFSKLTLERL